jgi:hypothetical protein
MAWQAIAFLVLGFLWGQAPSQAPAAAAQTQNAQPAAAQAADAQTALPTGPEQPLPFSHKNHAGTVGLPCETCHTLSRTGENLSIPQAAACMRCHQTIATDKPAIQRLAEYAKSQAPIPWARIYDLPSFVSFSHKTHLDHGNTCQECHGPVATRDRLFKESEMTMTRCVNCHTAKKANTGCDTCHAPQQ